MQCFLVASLAWARMAFDCAMPAVDRLISSPSRPPRDDVLAPMNTSILSSRGDTSS